MQKTETPEVETVEEETMSHEEMQALLNSYMRTKTKRGITKPVFSRTKRNARNAMAKQSRKINRNG